MTFDLSAELVAALRSPAGRAALAEVVGDATGAAVRAALAEREADRLLDGPALARYLGLTPAALRMRLRRGSSLGRLALDLDGRKVWRRADVDAAIRDGARLRLAAVGDRDE